MAPKKSKENRIPNKSSKSQTSNMSKQTHPPRDPKTGPPPNDHKPEGITNDGDVPHLDWIQHGRRSYNYLAPISSKQAATFKQSEKALAIEHAKRPRSPGEIKAHQNKQLLYLWTERRPFDCESYSMHQFTDGLLAALMSHRANSDLLDDDATYMSEVDCANGQQANFTFKVEQWDVLYPDGEDEEASHATEKARFQKIVRSFDVVLATLVAASDTFKAFIEPSVEGGSITCTDVDPLSMELWLKWMHGGEFERSDTRRCTVLDIWMVIETARRWDLPIQGIVPPHASTKFRGITAAQTWFRHWTDSRLDVKTVENKCTLAYEDAQALMYPCYALDFQDKFMFVTRWLVFNTPADVPITEAPPSGYYGEDYTLDPRILAFLNTVKDLLLEFVDAQLYAPLREFAASPVAKFRTVHEVLQQGLTDVGAYPLGETTVWHLTQRLKEYKNPDVSSLSEVPWNVPHLPAAVHDAAGRFEKAFSGLCLDCMAASDPETDVDPELHWRYRNAKGDVVIGCRSKHDFISWFNSYLGPEKRRKST
ncbi:uncharacterized protein LTR77_010184 [Saxophila tyrrhenica]|uniref:Uncharacterized protein n=1 Tax=Saxophila tyrrhenica TaxID=1690608 RepID=A0AAV9NWP2_9PEZI|nr:hypothetical protein LTR77_010184 [Saxophila tyrrhenica]